MESASFIIQLYRSTETYFNIVPVLFASDCVIPSSEFSRRARQKQLKNIIFRKPMLGDPVRRHEGYLAETPIFE